MYARISSKQAWNTEEFWGQKMVTLIPKACRRIFFSLDQNIPRRFVHLQHTSSHGDKDNRPWCWNFSNLMTEVKMFYEKITRVHHMFFICVTHVKLEQPHVILPHVNHMWNSNNHMWYYHMWNSNNHMWYHHTWFTCEIRTTTCDITTCHSHLNVKLEWPHVILPHLISYWSVPTFWNITIYLH